MGKRETVKSERMETDCSTLVDAQLAAQNALERKDGPPPTDLQKWERPSKLPETLSGIVDPAQEGGEAGDVEQQLPPPRHSDGGIGDIQVSLMVDSSASDYPGLAAAGAAVWVGAAHPEKGEMEAKGKKSAEFLVDQVASLLQILQQLCGRSVAGSMYAAACVGQETATKKVRHRAGNGERELRKILQSVSTYVKGPSNKRLKLLRKTILQNLSDLPFAEKQGIRLQFISNLAQALSDSVAPEDTRLNLFRVTDEDRYFLTDSKLLHFIVTCDWDATWSALMCFDDGHGGHAFRLHDGRRGRACRQG